MINQVILEGTIGTGLEMHHDTSGGDSYSCKITVDSDDLSHTDSVILTFPEGLVRNQLDEFEIGKMLGVKAKLSLTPVGRLQVLVQQIIFLRKKI